MFILASASPRRRELLEQIGAEFEIIPAKGEDVITGSSPQEVVMELSGQKAREVAERVFTSEESSDREKKTVILGADTVVAFRGQILGKPKDEADAARMLGMLSGNTHSVFTGVTVIVEENGKQNINSFYEETQVTMYSMTKRQIEAYIRTGEPMDKAGSYAIQGKCAVYIEKIQGDYNNVVGLPIARIFQEMGKTGIEIL